MEARPSALAEWIVGILIPPACREHVLGDLRERSTSSLAFVADGLSALPFVVWSRIRRTTTGLLLLAEVWSLTTAFVGASWMLAGPAFLTEPLGWLGLSMPIIKVIVVLAIIDAYTSPERRPRPLDVAAVLFSSATALGVEGTLGLLAPELALPGPVTLAAAGAGCVLLSTARAVVRPIQPTRRPPTRPSGMR